ncbi:MAG: polyhydroxybutyrate depolymerase [Burkholderiales bacterium]|nr:polyhydroxybutyrate depolymerase [Burkholderiales bacterium]
MTGTAPVRARRHALRLLGALLALVLAGATVPFAARAASEPGTTVIVTLRHDGMRRTALLHTPAHAAEHRPLPVVLNFHGGGGNALAQQRYSRMDALADRERFIAVYPNGTGMLQDSLLTWNAGDCCGVAAKAHIDDVGFVRALLDEVVRRLPVDASRVYATGLSNGAMMTYRLAAELSDRIAAIAPVAGATAMPAFKAARAVAILHIHSADDPRAIYGGGLGPPFPFTNVRVPHRPVEASLARWAEFAGCATAPEVEARRTGAAGTSRAAHTATLYSYPGCRDGIEVALWKLTGAGHVWPGGELDYLPRLLGPGTDVIDANVEMWRFFQRHRVPAAPK